ncbi:hypothetical protein ACHAW5_002762, partial [Stephanodiscus triporus]
SLHSNKKGFLNSSSSKKGSSKKLARGDVDNSKLVTEMNEGDAAVAEKKGDTQAEGNNGITEKGLVQKSSNG